MDFRGNIFGDKALTYAELEAALKDNKEVKLASGGSCRTKNRLEFPRGGAFI